ncbi:MAG: oligosaccharide flippase family protein [Candidatus Sedimenticola sp. (ex Thyasira tokunagai)]
MPSSINLNSATIWNFASQGVRQVLKLGSNLLLTRLLTPEMFGIAAIGNALINGINLLSDFGIKPHVIQSKREDAAYFQTAWTIQLLRGLLLTVVIVLLAKPLSELYSNDSLYIFLLLLAISNIAMGFNNIEIYHDFRYARLKKFVIVDLTSAVIGLACMVAWAWVYPSHIALAIGAVVSTSTFMIGTLIIYPRHNCRFRLDKSAVSDLVSFGGWVLVSTTLIFAIKNIDRLALGKLITLDILGFYSIALMWASMPLTIINQWANRVLYPLLSMHVKENSGEKVLLSVHRIYVLFATITVIIIYAISDLLIENLYTPEYGQVALFLQQLLGVFMLYSIEQSYSLILLAHGRPKDKIAGQVAGLILYGLALLPAFYWSGVTGVILLMGAVISLQIFWSAYKAFGFSLYVFGFDILMVALFFLVAQALHALVMMNAELWYQLLTSAVIAISGLFVMLTGYNRLKGC